VIALSDEVGSYSGLNFGTATPLIGTAYSHLSRASNTGPRKASRQQSKLRLRLIHTKEKLL